MSQSGNGHGGVTVSELQEHSCFPGHGDLHRLDFIRPEQDRFWSGRAGVLSLSAVIDHYKPIPSKPEHLLDRHYDHSLTERSSAESGTGPCWCRGRVSATFVDVTFDLHTSKVFQSSVGRSVEVRLLNEVSVFSITAELWGGL